jgi:hypothetical protein
MADELFRHHHKQKIWPMCSLNIALRNYMAGEVSGIVLFCRCVFGQFNRTKNRGACVDIVIWLAGLYDRPD